MSINKKDSLPSSEKRDEQKELAPEQNEEVIRAHIKEIRDRVHGLMLMSQSASEKTEELLPDISRQLEFLKEDNELFWSHLRRQQESMNNIERVLHKMNELFGYTNVHPAIDEIRENLSRNVFFIKQRLDELLGLLPNIQAELSSYPRTLNDLKQLFDLLSPELRKIEEAVDEQRRFLYGFNSNLEDLFRFATPQFWTDGGEELTRYLRYMSETQEELQEVLHGQSSLAEDFQTKLLNLRNTTDKQAGVERGSKRSFEEMRTQTLDQLSSFNKMLESIPEHELTMEQKEIKTELLNTWNFLAGIDKKFN